MRAFIFTLLTLTLTLLGQTPPPQPEWIEALRTLQQETHQAPLGSLDAKFESAWRSAVQSPWHPQFPMAVEIVSGFYQSQGYEVKAEQILRQAIALAPDGDSPSRRALNNRLAPSARFNPTAFQAVSFQHPSMTMREWQSTGIARTRCMT